MINIRYPNINGKTDAERMRQMESFQRYLVDQINWALSRQNGKEQQQENVENGSAQSDVSQLKKEFHKELEKVTTELSKNWEKIYPIGSIYISVSSNNPASLFGGTWEQIQDKFLLASGSAYAAGATGGEATHTLTADEMPKHRHGLALYDKSWTDAAESKTDGVTYGAWTDTGIRTLSQNTPGVFTGGSQPHNNMPPYLAVYVWKRTA